MAAAELELYSYMGVTEVDIPSNPDGINQKSPGKPFGTHLQGVALANLADGIIVGAVPLIAVSLTRSPGEIALIQMVFWLPWLLFGLVAGIVVDRSDRRHIQLIGSAVRVLIMLIVANFSFTDRLTMPVGALVGGMVGKDWGLPAVFLGSVVTMLVAGAWVCTQLSTSLVQQYELA